MWLMCPPTVHSATLGFMSLKTGPQPKPVEERFMAFVSPEPNSGCWLWTGHIAKTGYGRFGMKNETGVGHRWKAIEAHQVSYTLFVGEPPRGIAGDCDVIDHICNNKACVNPAHLNVINRVDNILKGRK